MIVMIFVEKNLEKSKPRGSTVYQEIFASLYFHEFHDFCLVTKLNFAKVSPCHIFYVATWIIRKIIEVTIFAKIYQRKISRYTV